MGGGDIDWVGVTCHGFGTSCRTGAEYAPEQGPGTGWVYLPEGDWLCPACAANAIKQGADDADELAMMQRGDVVVEAGRRVYVLTGEERPPGDGEHYLIGPYTVGTSDGRRMFRPVDAQIVREIDTSFEQVIAA